MGDVTAVAPLPAAPARPDGSGPPLSHERLDSLRRLATTGGPLAEVLAELDVQAGMVDAFARLSDAQNAELVRLSGMARDLGDGRVGPGVLSVRPGGREGVRHVRYECGACGEPVGGAAPFRLAAAGAYEPPWRFCPCCGAALGDYPPADGRHLSPREV